MVDRLQVRVVFEGELLRKLDDVKKHFGLENATEVIRVLVNERHTQLSLEGASGLTKMGEAKYIFKDQICDAKGLKKSLTCQKGTLKFTGQNVMDFNLYRTWCKGCDKIKIIDRKEFTDCFKDFAKKVEEVVEIDE